MRSVSQDSPQDFELQGSEDGQSWSTVAALADERGWSMAEDRTYLVPEQQGGAVLGPFANYRLLVRIIPSVS